MVGRVFADSRPCADDASLFSLFPWDRFVLRNRIYTIGYAGFEPEGFARALAEVGATAVADVRSSPYGAFKPAFNREALRSFLQSRGGEYVFLGDALGARFPDRAVYVDGVADFERIARHPLFLGGIARLLRGAATMGVAVLCAERDPLTCHRGLLVGRKLAESLDVWHILDDGLLESQAGFEARLLGLYSRDQAGLPGLESHRAVDLAEAYRLRGREIGHRLGNRED